MREATPPGRSAHTNEMAKNVSSRRRKLKSKGTWALMLIFSTVMGKSLLAMSVLPSTPPHTSPGKLTRMLCRLPYVKMCCTWLRSLEAWAWDTGR